VQLPIGSRREGQPGCLGITGDSRAEGRGGTEGQLEGTALFVASVGRQELQACREGADGADVLYEPAVVGTDAHQYLYKGRW
jgi:hypothetical protein